MSRCWWIYFDCDASVLQILTIQCFGKFYFILYMLVKYIYIGRIKCRDKFILDTHVKLNIFRLCIKSKSHSFLIT